MAAISTRKKITYSEQILGKAKNSKFAAHKFAQAFSFQPSTQPPTKKSIRITKIYTKFVRSTKLARISMVVCACVEGNNTAFVFNCCTIVLRHQIILFMHILWFSYQINRSHIFTCENMVDHRVG